MQHNHGKHKPNLLIGFDSAWGEAFTTIKDLQNSTQADIVTIFVDQPVIVTNQTGQRPVEKIVSSIISKLGGGVQQLQY